MKKRILKKQLQALSTSCPRLEYLRLSRLPMTELFLTFRSPHLTVLDVSFNPSLCLTGLSALHSLFPSLRWLVLLGSTLLDEQVRRMKLTALMPQLQVVAQISHVPPPPRPPYVSALDAT